MFISLKFYYFQFGFLYLKFLAPKKRGKVLKNRVYIYKNYPLLGGGWFLILVSIHFDTRYPKINLFS